MSLPYCPRPPASCDRCGFLADCGGLEGEAYHRGCFARCVERCVNLGCDVACPCLHFDFAEMVEEAGGLWQSPTISLLSPEANILPPYIAEIQHGGSRRRALPEDVVALPLSSILRRDRYKRAFIPFSSADELRDAFHLSRRSRILIVGVGKDQPLEDFWETHVTRDLIGQLARLNLSGMSVPNFSFMSDVPRLNSLVNLSRMFRIAERLTERGIPTVLHLQASTRFDWGRWRDVMQMQADSHYVALEFQTGTRQKEVGDKYYFGLRDLQEKLGRALHPLMVAGGGRLRDLRKDFPTFSVIDSVPFMRTMKRRSLKPIHGYGWRWVKELTLPGELLDHRLASNIANNRKRMLDSLGIGHTWEGGESLFSSAA